MGSAIARLNRLRTSGLTVVAVCEERRGAVGCVEGGRAWSLVCMPVLPHARVYVHVFGPVLTKFAG